MQTREVTSAIYSPGWGTKGACDCRLTIDAAAAVEKGSEKRKEEGREFDSAGLKHTTDPPDSSSDGKSRG